MPEIYVATSLYNEKYGYPSISVLCVGTYEACKSAIHNEWNRIAEHEDIEEFDESEDKQWVCSIVDTLSYTKTFELHKVDTLVGD